MLGTCPLHLLADAVNLDQVFRSDQPLSHHRPVDDLRAQIIRRRNPVPPAEPGIGEQILPLGRFYDLVTRDRQKRAGIQTQRSRGFLITGLGVAAKYGSASGAGAAPPDACRSSIEGPLGREPAGQPSHHALKPAHAHPHQ